MDSQLFDYSSNVNLQNLEWLFNSINNVKNFMISVDWHQRVISRDYGWNAGYKDIVSMIGAENT